jgi:hypothetical protein
VVVGNFSEGYGKELVYNPLGMDEVRGTFSTKLSVMKDYPDKMTVEPAADVVGGRRSHV